jgi:hypothetical protein
MNYPSETVTSGNNKRDALSRNLLKTSDVQRVMLPGHVSSQAVNTVEPRVLVNPEVDQPDGLQKFINLAHFVRGKPVKGTVDDLFAVDRCEDADSAGWTINPCIVKGRSPFLNLSVIAGRFLFWAQVNFHFVLWSIKSKNLGNAFARYHYTKKYFCKFVRVPA